MGLFSGILGAIGGLFGGGSKKQTTTSEVDYQKMVNRASAAGFNPLTAIRNGGSAGFTTTTSPTISNTSEILGNLGGILGDALENKLDPIQAKKRELDTALVDQQLRELKQGPQLPASFKQARTFTGTKVSQQNVPRLGATSVNKTAAVARNYTPLNPNLIAGKPPEASDIGMNNGRYGWFDPGWISDAGGAISDAYGEPGEWVGGVLKAGTAIPYSIYRNAKSGLEDASKHRKALKNDPKKPASMRWVGPYTKNAVSDFFRRGYRALERQSQNGGAW
ncbi:hypothetical protein [Flyfo microvirus Tbat2_91]|nr:hypothetical protein [Flyfo microvirus Tbat2_91]